MKVIGPEPRVKFRHEAKLVRSYFLSPVARFKDERSGLSGTDVSAVLDGDIDQFLLANLSARALLSDRGGGGGEDKYMSHKHRVHAWKRFLTWLGF